MAPGPFEPIPRGPLMPDPRDAVAATFVEPRGMIRSAAARCWAGSCSVASARSFDVPEVHRKGAESIAAALG
jgi:hypothetical protein